MGNPATERKKRQLKNRKRREEKTARIAQKEEKRLLKKKVGIYGGGMTAGREPIRPLGRPALAPVVLPQGTMMVPVPGTVATTNPNVITVEQAVQQATVPVTKAVPVMPVLNRNGIRKLPVKLPITKRETLTPPPGVNPNHMFSHANFEKLDASLPSRKDALERQRAKLAQEATFRKYPIPAEKFECWWRVTMDTQTMDKGKDSDNQFEQEMENLFKDFGVQYTRPERGEDNPLPRGMATVDYYLPDYQLYIEVKHWPGDRLLKQIERVMPWPVMVLVRETAVVALRRMFEGMVNKGVELGKNTNINNK